VVPRIWRCLQNFWKICGFLMYMTSNHREMPSPSALLWDPQMLHHTILLFPLTNLVLTGNVTSVTTICQILLYFSL
jgi:hypothetical protein